MNAIPESVNLDIECPACGKKSSQSLRRLHDKKEFTCQRCRERVKITGDGLRKIEAAFRDAEKKLAEITKRPIKIDIKL